MSELGQNEGQEQDKNIPFFDSSKISDKKDVEHFSNVEGAEERARKAEQAKKAAEKEAQEVHAADIRAASEQMKKQEQGESGKKGGIVGFLFSGWHKIVTIVAIFALVVAGIFLAINVSDESYDEKKRKEKEALDFAAAVEDDARTTIDVCSGNNCYEEAKKKYEDALVGADKYESVFLKIMYACFVYDNTKDVDLALAILNGVESSIETEVAADYYNYRVKNMYYESGMGEDFQDVIVEAE